MPSEKKPSDRAAESGMINIAEKTAWLCRVVEATESKKGNSHEVKVEILNDDGTPFLKANGESTVMSKWVPKKEGYFKEAFLKVFLPHIAENGGDWEYDDLLNKYAIANMKEEDRGADFGGGKRINISVFDAVPEAQRALIEQAVGGAAEAPAAKPTPKPAAAKPAAPAKPAVPAGVKAAAAPAAKPAAAKPAQAAKPAPAKPATSTAVDEDVPFGE